MVEPAIPPHASPAMYAPAYRTAAATLKDARLWDLAAFHLSLQGDPKAAEARAQADALRASLLPAGPFQGT